METLQLLGEALAEFLIGNPDEDALVRLVDGRGGSEPEAGDDLLDQLLFVARFQACRDLGVVLDPGRDNDAAGRSRHLTQGLQIGHAGYQIGGAANPVCLAQACNRTH